VNNMTTLPYRRQQVTPWSGGRTTEAGRNAGKASGRGLQTAGNTALNTALKPALDTALNTALKPALDPARAVAAPARLRVAPPAPVTAPRAPFVALVLFLVISGVLGILILNTKINEDAFRLNDLQASQGMLDQQEAELGQDLALLSSPGNLAAAARRLGLVRSEPAYLRLSDGTVLGFPKPATGAPSASGPAQAGR
jgi:hypothetical protein